MNTDKLPTCAQYYNHLNEAVKTFKITINEARNMYGTKTIQEWNKLLNQTKL